MIVVVPNTSNQEVRTAVRLKVMKLPVKKYPRPKIQKCDMAQVQIIKSSFVLK